MKIGSFESKPVAATPAQEKKGAAATAAGAQPAAEPSAQVALSSAASLLVKSADDPSTFDAAKVERIATAIRDGTYKINAEAIADKLIANAQELLGKTPR